MFTVAGGKADAQGVSIGRKISKGFFRAMLDSALGLDPSDMSEAARAKRQLRGLADLDGLTFAVKIRVEPSNHPSYADSNRLDRVVLPGEPEWRRTMEGGAVPAPPRINSAAPKRNQAARQQRLDLREDSWRLPPLSSLAEPPARWSRSTSWNRRPAPSPRA